MKAINKITYVIRQHIEDEMYLEKLEYQSNQNEPDFLNLKLINHGTFQ